jgi:hypothetical protein
MCPRIACTHGLIAALFTVGWSLLGAEDPSVWQDGRSVTVSGLSLAEFSGTPAAIGDQTGHVFASRIRHLLAAVMIPNRDPQRLARLAEAIPAGYREELAALAAAAGVSGPELTRANLIVDTMCSVVVRLGDVVAHRPLRLGRNLDFSPADQLGPGTVVSVLRQPGKHVVVSVSWPGCTGVVSGMNDAGLTVSVLVHLGAGAGSKPATGTPLCYRVRALLEDAASCEEAVVQFAASPVASTNYVVIADATQAVAVWQDAGVLRRTDPNQGWLFCTNGPLDAARGGADDPRGRCLRALAGACASGDVDAAWLHGALAAVYLRNLNAQAMVLVPGERRLQLATGTSSHPAALGTYRELDLAPLFAGEPITTVVPTVLGPVVQAPAHYQR